MGSRSSQPFGRGGAGDLRTSRGGEKRGRGLQREQLNGEQLLIEDGDVDLEEDELEFGIEEEELVDAGRERAAAGSPSRCQ